jgi:hypothetical protein
MKRFSLSRAVGWSVCGLLFAVLAQSCGASESETPVGGTGGTGNVDPPDTGDATIDVTPNNGGANGESTYNPLCGVVDCVPDRADACPPTTMASSGDSAGGTGGATNDGGRNADGAGRGSGGASDGGMGGEGGQPDPGGAGGEGTSGTSGSASGGTAGGPSTVNACQVRPKNAEPRAQCVPAGTGMADAPCLGADDCAPGLACVEAGDAGQCRPYCCEAGSCPDRTYCFERTLFGVTPALDVPVCVPAVDCGLAEPFPCPEDATCSCPEGLACMALGVDRRTTCAQPGRGGFEGQDCPCRRGYVCSQVTNQCVKLCQTTAPEDCATGMCQASAELPLGWGVCIGMPRPDGG